MASICSRLGKQAQVPDKLGDCFLASQSGEETGEGGGEPMGVDTFVNCFCNKGFLKTTEWSFIYLNEKPTEGPIVRRKNCMSNIA